MAKKKEQKPEPEEVGLRYEPDRMIFKLGEKEFFIPKGVALNIFQKPSMEEAFIQAAYSVKDEFAEFNVPDFILRFTAAFEHFRNIAAVAKHLEVDPNRLRLWMNDTRFVALKRKVINGLDGETPNALELLEKYRAEFRTEEKEKIPRFKEDPTTLERVALMVIDDGFGPRQIAQKCGYEYTGFLKWFTGQQTQNRIANFRLNLEVEREVARKREEEAEKK